MEVFPDADSGYLKIERKEDRVTIASILISNDYAVAPMKSKKDGRSNMYFLKYWKPTSETSKVEDVINEG